MHLMDADSTSLNEGRHRDGPGAGQAARRGARHRGGPVVGGFFLFTGGVHLGLVAADTEVYRPFADAALFDFVRDGWESVFMAHPAVFGLLLMLGEVTAGVLLLLGGRAGRVGWTAVIVFHLLLMLFGFGIWVWCIPALVVLGVLARRDRVVGPED